MKLSPALTDNEAGPKLLTVPMQSKIDSVFLKKSSKRKEGDGTESQTNREAEPKPPLTV
jgi:hypothetical protein